MNARLLLILMITFLAFLNDSAIAGSDAKASSPHTRPREEMGGAAANYEAITGESLDDDRSVWDSFYKTKNNAFGKEAVGFLKDQLHVVKKGRAFVPAMGEGRNAIFLAKRGFDVDGNDLSEVAVDRAMDEAKNQKITIHGVVADLNEMHYQENYYDLVMVSLFYMPGLVPKFKRSLKRGGYIIFYEKRDTGKNTSASSPDDFLVKSEELKNVLKDFEIKVFKEYKDHNVEVVGVLARKP